MFGISKFSLIFVGFLLAGLVVPRDFAVAQQDQKAPTQEERDQLQDGLKKLSQLIDALRTVDRMENRTQRALFADVAVFAKAVEWQLRHDEFFKPDYVKQAQRAIETGISRAQSLADEKAPWVVQEGSTIRGYVSKVDQSIQPYAITLPANVNPRDGKRWPLHVVLHGRANQMNEVNFISKFEGRTPRTPVHWIQLDVYGRGSNAYRWSGETDVFEAIADVKRRFRIDENRITLHGFSMGGAGAWHLGMHYPHLWSSVGPGAGFVDFYKYQNQSDRLPAWQHQTLGIYDAVDYALNAANVPVCTYGGEIDPQLAASTTMAEAAREEEVEIKVIVGPGMGHKFDPKSQQEFMAFHIEKSEAGRPSVYDRRHIRFTTRTLRYNTCDWLTIEEVETVYAPSTIDARINSDGDVEVNTSNITAFRLNRDIATNAIIDGTLLPCRTAADGLLPDVWYQRTEDAWQVLDYDSSREFAENPELSKRHGLQGPIDDAFMDAFVCVRPTQPSLIPAANTWAKHQLEVFEQEFDFWLRGKVQVVEDKDVTEEHIAGNNLILFGDPQSNALIARVVQNLPIEWTTRKIRVGHREWDASTHGLSMIYPNPLNPHRYVVINSGHTMHDVDFKASNAWLFPRMGDIAVRRLQPVPATNDRNSTDQSSTDIVWAENFNSNWLLDEAE
ncbi:MAG: prolyl oligopeptidase family serine peptidase [Planctomycetaceae bacterium]|nr:prolyl oligopeptidase family serine peptidase [Planctomycetaceae bacterium]